MSTIFVDTDDITRAVEAIANPLDHLVGEGKKFKTPEDLARGKLHSDLYVPKLENENNELKGQYALLKAELETLKSRAMETVEMVNEANTNSSINDVTQSTLRPEDIDSLVDKKLSARSEAEKRQANIDYVALELEKNLGSNQAKHMGELADEYGKEFLMKMAAENPKAFLRLALPQGTSKPGTSNKPSTDLFSPPVNALNTTARNMVNGEQIKGHKYYHELRRKDPKKFNSPEIYRERLEAITRLGDEYMKH
jgi:hypothetical protein